LAGFEPAVVFAAKGRSKRSCFGPDGQGAAWCVSGFSRRRKTRDGFPVLWPDAKMQGA